jgi:hypothetical protein
VRVPQTTDVEAGGAEAGSPGADPGANDSSGSNTKGGSPIAALSHDV